MINFVYFRFLNKANYLYNALILLKKYIKLIDEAHQLEA